MHAPLFWKYKTRISTALQPAAAIYGFFARKKAHAVQPTKLSVPIVCVGNAVVGGAGKTPVALALGELLKARGIKAHYLSRGYKGKLSGPVQVDSSHHTAAQVGDEPLMLAQVLPTWVAKNRLEGAKAAIAAGAELILMDDGFQNPTLHKDRSLLVIDGSYGIGNGLLLPAGPLREPIEEAMKRASCILLVGEDRHNALAHAPKDLPVLQVRIEPAAEAHALKDLPVLAFAGIARPRKFYRTLQELGCDVRRMVAYPDHYLFTRRDLDFLRHTASELAARLVTTHKDYVRLPEAMRAEVACVHISAVFGDPAAALGAILP